MVFKIYETVEGQRAFTREVDVFEMLEDWASDVIVECFGSFMQRKKSVVMLEYADGGNLETFFTMNQQPKNFEEMERLWTELMKLLRALEFLHALRGAGGEASTVGWLVAVLITFRYYSSRKLML